MANRTWRCVRNYLQHHGVSCELLFNQQKSKANLLATIGPADVPGIVLSGHTDVVPVDGQRWSVAPFELSEKDGNLYGRGTADMKGYIACVLASVPALVQAPLCMPVHIALFYDEEVGCLGVRSLIEAFHAKPVKPLLCLIGKRRNSSRCWATRANWRCAAKCMARRAIRPMRRRV